MVTRKEVMPSRSLITLLSGIVDYAGLFPPASLTMAEAVRNYATYLQGSDAWALGRFIVPASRLVEFEREIPRSPSSPWKLSVLVGSDMRNELTAVHEFNRRNHDIAAADAVELKAGSVEEIATASALVPETFHLFVEIPIQSDPAPLVRAIGNAGRFAKVRTGGITADAFPSSNDLARFLRACVTEQVPFKATAGLHHPIRSIYNLTYKPGSERGMMYGHLNVFLAAAFATQGMSETELTALLEEKSRDAFRFDDAGVTWRSRRLRIEEIERMRRSVGLSFGSCSFREPMDELRMMKLL